MGTAAVMAPEANEEVLQTSETSSQPPGSSDEGRQPGQHAQRQAKRRRCSGEHSSGSDPDGLAFDRQKQTGAGTSHRSGGNKREHGHHGHLRTHHSADGDSEDDGAAGPGTAAFDREHNIDRQTNGAHPPGSSTKPRRPQLSFLDDIDDGTDEGDGNRSGGGMGGGLRTATADRFRSEAAAAARGARHTAHAFHPHRRRSDEALTGGDRSQLNGDNGGVGAGGGLKIVDGSDSSDGDEGALALGRAGGSAGHGKGSRAGGRTLGRVHFGVAAARGLRPYMEDRHVVVSALGLLSDAPGGGERAGAPLPPDGVPRSYAAVFDGHNGAGAAELAAARLHVLLAAHPALRIHTGELGPPAVAKAEEVAIGDALRSAFGRVDEATLAVARREGVRDGATALVVLRIGQILYAAHAGDSRAVMCRDGVALRLTEDHKPHLPRERTRIEAAGGRVDFQRCWRVVVEPRDGRPGSGLAVSRSLGDLDFKEPRKFVECEPDVLRTPLRPLQSSGTGDSFVILGSDGLWDVMSDDDAVDCANRALQSFKKQGLISIGGGSSSSSSSAGDAAAKAAADALLDESLRRGTADNVTVVTMLLHWG